jgi:oxygen-independent coproporphyrinogen-3 oxidase
VVERVAEGVAGTGALGLYVHVPFCQSICNYCNFNRGLLDEAQKRRYVDAVCREIAESQPAAADSIYFGGGTPSLLMPDEVSRIVGACRDRFDVDPQAEVTLEANPEGVTLQRIEGFLAAGVNRLSYGVQSFRDDELRRLTRRHSADRARAAVQEARQAGLDNVSLDLMMWLPGQSVSQWLESVDGLIDVAPAHASLYMLEVYPNAPLRDEMARSGWSTAPDDDVAEMYVLAMERLERAGYEQYEISNVARPGRRSRHNLKYWQDGEWLGVGPGAHSTRAGVRWRNEPAIGRYVDAVEGQVPLVVERRAMDDAERLQEALITGLRLRDGVSLGAVARRYGVDVWARFGAALHPFIDGGWLIYDHGTLRLTRAGMLVGHEIMAAFLP